MEIIYLPKAGEDLNFWINSGNNAILKKIAQLTEANCTISVSWYWQT